MTTVTAHLEAELEQALAVACRTAQIDPAGAQLVRYTVNAVYFLPSEQVVVRLRKGASDAIESTVRIAQWLTQADAPVTHLVSQLDQPFWVGDYCATFWVAAERAKGKWQGADLALALREFHQLASVAELREWDPFGMIRRRADKSNLINQEEHDWILAQCAELELSYHDRVSSLATGVIHADAHVGNLLRDRSGRFVLCDLDSVVRGPLIWDLVPTAVEAMRFRQEVRHATLAHAYGRDVTREEVWPLFRRIRELAVTTAGLANGQGRPGMAAQARFRLESLLAGDTTARWRGYSKV